MCREHLAAVRRRAGWHEHQRPPGTATRRSPAPRPNHAPVAMTRRVSAGHAVGRMGVAGALPPPLMGHGWPALPRAGSAARSPARGGNAPAPQPEDAPPS
jgi:hypothetical protein